MTAAPHSPDRYGRSFADVYDDWYSRSFDTERAVTALRALAGVGPVLELGVGTGRLAVPLAAGGLPVVGIDASREMLDRCPPTPGLELVCGDMRRVADHVAPPNGADGFTLAFCAFNTILNLTSPDAIVECLDGTRRLLAPDGRIVLEGFVPVDLDLLPTDDLSPARVISADPVFVESHLDRDSRVLHGRHLQVRPDRVEARPWAVIVLGPDGLTAVAARAGLVVDAIASGWDGSAFDDTSEAFVMTLRTLHP